jgi:hypothetical protein
VKKNKLLKEKLQLKSQQLQKGKVKLQLQKEEMTHHLQKEKVKLQLQKAETKKRLNKFFCFFFDGELFPYSPFFYLC